MPDLSLQNIDQISRDISREEINFSHLLDDLIDHVCCDVEFEMQKGKSFIDAYKSVKERMGSRRLKEIQEETLYLVDTKYRNMKNTMKISGVAGTIMYGCAVLFKIQHWPMAGIMLSLGSLILAFVFLPSALTVLWKETHNRKRLILFISAFISGLLFIIGTLTKVQHWPFAGIILSLAAVSGIFFFIPLLTISRLTDQESKTKNQVYILGALGAICYIIGLLFKIQHWPYATILMIAGTFILSFLVLPWYSWLNWRNESFINSKFIYILIGLILIVAPGALINLNLQEDYNKGFNSHDEEQKALFSYSYNNNAALMAKYRDSVNYAAMEELHIKTDSVISVINQIQASMVLEPVSLLPGGSSRKELDEAILAYKTSLTLLDPKTVNGKYMRLLEPSVFFSDNVAKDGGNSHLSGQQHFLELLKNSILMVESCIITDIAKTN